MVKIAKPRITSLSQVRGGTAVRGLPSGIGAGLSMDVSIDIKPAPVIMVRNFDNMGIDIRSYREPLKRAVQKVAAPSFRKNFAVGGRPAWLPLSDFTTRQKKGQGKDNGILIRSGRLQRVAGQLNIWKIDGQKGTAVVERLPSKVNYGKYHQGDLTGFGLATGQLIPQQADLGNDRLPARPFMVLQHDDVVEIEAIFMDWIDERLMAHQRRWGTV